LFLSFFSLSNLSLSHYFFSITQLQNLAKPNKMTTQVVTASAASVVVGVVDNMEKIRLHVNETSKMGMANLLHHASMNGDIEAAILLLKNGAVVNAKDRHGNSPLHYACEAFNLEMMELLMSYGADIDEKMNVNANETLRSWFDDGEDLLVGKPKLVDEELVKMMEAVTMAEEEWKASTRAILHDSTPSAPPHTVVNDENGVPSFPTTVGIPEKELEKADVVASSTEEILLMVDQLIKRQKDAKNKKEAPSRGNGHGEINNNAHLAAHQEMMGSYEQKENHLLEAVAEKNSPSTSAVNTHCNMLQDLTKELDKAKELANQYMSARERHNNKQKEELVEAKELVKQMTEELTKAMEQANQYMQERDEIKNRLKKELADTKQIANQYMLERDENENKLKEALVEAKELINQCMFERDEYKNKMEKELVEVREAANQYMREQDEHKNMLKEELTAAKELAKQMTDRLTEAKEAAKQYMHKQDEYKNKMKEEIAEAKGLADHYMNERDECKNTLEKELAEAKEHAQQLMGELIEAKTLANHNEGKMEKELAEAKEQVNRYMRERDVNKRKLIKMSEFCGGMLASM
jgi:Ankyrin repeats (3 copies)